MSAQPAFRHQTVTRDGDRRRLSVVTRRGRLDPSAMLRCATLGLAEERPHFSARHVVTRVQAVLFLAFSAALFTAFVVRPIETADIAVAGMSVGFVCSLALRGALALLGRRPEPAILVGNDHTLPVYTILVPVYREAGMIPQMACALAALDYPSDKLDIHLVVEEDDRETRAAVVAAGLNAVVVPPSLPRTKPKAGFALSSASSGLFEFAAEFGASV